MDPANVRPAVAYPFLATYVSGFLFLEKKTASHLTFLALRYQSRIRTKKMISAHAKSILGFKNCNFTTKHQKQNLIAPLSCSQQKHQNKISL